MACLLKTTLQQKTNMLNSHFPEQTMILENSLLYPFCCSLVSGSQLCFCFCGCADDLNNVRYKLTNQLESTRE